MTILIHYGVIIVLIAVQCFDFDPIIFFHH